MAPLSTRTDQTTRVFSPALARDLPLVAIPCHRVVGNDGAWSGYRWGIERKRRLLEREAAS